jgi:hypothetical protein
MNRGDIATVDFSRYDPADKLRPALVAQNPRSSTTPGVPPAPLPRLLFHLLDQFNIQTQRGGDRT